MSDATTRTYVPEFPGFDVEAELGRGGMGVVYRAFDRRRGGVVALKTLQHVDPAALWRFKQEFRALADVSHPNLVGLYELVAEEGRWFFTMELVEGEHFLERVRFGADLRRTARQLAEAVAALHAAGLLHRDIKPTNVLVTRDGRAVLLDFGLAAELSQSGTHQSTQRHVLGTAAYMSPEQATGDPVSAASDWYSFGVLLYEAMTGRLPYPGTTGSEIWRALVDPSTPPPAPPVDVTPGSPEDLSDLVVALLARDPRARPDGAQVLRVLQSDASAARPALAAGGLVGRDAQLAALGAAFAEMRGGRPVVVFAHGVSGIGKSALVERFLEEVVARDDAVVLAGRCYERESVPFKALDSPIDELTRFLARLPKADAEALLPRDVGPITRLFPVLLRVEALAVGARRGVATTDVHEMRRRATAALREILGRIGDRRPLVLYVDDLQWGDLDSANLLLDVLRPPDPPRVLVIGSYRRDDAQKSPFLSAMFASPLAADRRDMPVDPLSAEDAAALAVALSGGRLGRDSGIVFDLVREAGGNPLFVRELVEHLDETRAPRAAGSKLTLDRVLFERVERLAPQTRRLLEVVCVAGRPIHEETALSAAAPLDDPTGALAALRTARFVRVHASSSLDTYHDRVRESVLAHLSSDAVREHHSRIAAAMESSRAVDAEDLARHLEAAGDARRAGAEYARAASKAAETLAFDHAAQLYRRAIELADPGRDERRVLLTRLGEALGGARRCGDAADAYLAAAQCAGDDDALALRLLACDHLLMSGRIDEWFDIARPVLRSVGLSLPASHGAALASILFRKTLIALRGYGIRERPAADIPASTLASIDTAAAVATAMTMVSPIYAVECQTRHLLLALRTGEPARAAFALAAEACHSAIGGTRYAARTARLVTVARALAVRSGSEHADVLTRITEILVAAVEGRWRDCVARSLAVEVRGRTANWTFMRNLTMVFPGFAMDFLGSFRELAAAAPGWIADAASRSDLFLETELRTRIGYFPPLLEDDPAAADAGLVAAISRWSQRSFLMQHFRVFEGRIPIAIYDGRPADALALVESMWTPLRRSWLLEIQLLRLIAWFMRGRASLAVAAGSATDAKRRAALLCTVDADARRMTRQRTAYGTAWAEMLRAGAASIRGDARTAAARLQEAERGFVATDMACWSAVARRRRGQLVAGDEGRALVADADEWMRGQGIVNPSRWADMYAPGKWS
jgi:hypothetical protein